MNRPVETHYAEAAAPFLPQEIERKGLIIGITSDGGGGHNAAWQAIKTRLEYASFETKTVNFLGNDIIGSIDIPFMGNLGKYCVDRWDKAQIEGDIAELNNTANLRWISDLIFYPIAIKKFTDYLLALDEEPKEIISTQALSLDALAQAILNVNQKRHWNMRLSVHMTDLPTNDATHFYRSLKVIGKNERLSQIVTLCTPTKPACNPKESSNAFWQRHIGNVAVIQSPNLPIRKAFFEHHCTIGKEATLNIVTHNNGIKEVVPFQINPLDHVTTLMLGSRPPTKSVNGYIDAFVNTITATSDKAKNYYFFIYCGKPEEADKPNDLLQSVNSRLLLYKENSTLPPNLHIVPFTYQDDNTLAPLFHRSNAVITKSGGSTCFELMQLDNDPVHKTLPLSLQRSIFIHSEGLAPQSTQFFDLLLFLWDAVIEFLKWYLRVKEPEAIHVDESNLLSNNDLNHIKKVCENTPGLQIDLCSDNLDRFFTKLGTADKWDFTEFHKALLVERKVNQLIKERYATQISGKPLPDYHQLRKEAVDSLLCEQGITLWEKGNAEMLKLLIQNKVQVVNPTYISHFLPEVLFQERDLITPSMSQNDSPRPALALQEMFDLQQEALELPV